MHHWCTTCRRPDGGPLQLIHFTSKQLGKCINCRGLDTADWYREWVEDKHRRLVQEPAERAKRARLRVYGKSGYPTVAESVAEARGKAVGQC